VRDSSDVSPTFSSGETDTDFFVGGQSECGVTKSPTGCIKNPSWKARLFYASWHTQI